MFAAADGTPQGGTGQPERFNLLGLVRLARRYPGSCAEEAHHILTTPFENRAMFPTFEKGDYGGFNPLD